MAKPNTPHRAVAIAALAVDISQGGAEPPVDFRLIPAGEFRSRDGRPAECAAWICDAADGQRIVASLSAQADAAVIDYEHATLLSRKTGNKAPAAGWFKNAEWRDDGVWLLGVDWTALAADHIANKEYRYVSPVFKYDPKTGHVLQVIHAALVNHAGIDGLTDLAALAAEVFDNQPQTEISPMNQELLEKWIWILNLPEGSTEADVLAQLDKVIAQIKGSDPAVAANGFDLGKFIADSQSQVAALSAQIADGGQPDPAKFVPIAALSALQTEHAAQSEELAALKDGAATAALNAELERGRSLNKITPALEAWATDLGKSNLAALSAYIDNAAAVVPTSTQTQGAPTGGPQTAALSADIKKICAQFGVSEADYLKTANAEGNA